MCLLGMLASPLGDGGNPVAKEAALRDTALAVACPQFGKSIPEQGRELAVRGYRPKAAVPENAAGTFTGVMWPNYY